MRYETKIVGFTEIETCAACIKNGGIVAFPTETVYGLGGDAFNEKAAEKIYEAKNRPADNPFIVHVHDISEIEKVGYLTPDAKKVFEAFAPGPITVVLKKRAEIPLKVTAGLDTVGVRIPSHDVARAFLKACNTPVAAPSANISKKVSPTLAEHVYSDLNGKIEYILDGGMSDVGIESTVISLVKEPVILRPGAVTYSMLRKVLPDITVHNGEVDGTPASPGMKYKHYSPEVPCVLFSDTNSLMFEYNKICNQGKKPIVLCLSDKSEELQKRGANVCSMGKTIEEVAGNMFALMRHYESRSDYIFIQSVQSNGIGEAVMNRLIKSCGGRHVPGL